jgi:hypothetical protein
MGVVGGWPAGGVVSLEADWRPPVTTKQPVEDAFSSLSRFKENFLTLRNQLSAQSCLNEPYKSSRFSGSVLHNFFDGVTQSV